MRAVLFAIVALLCTVPTFGQTAKMYKWMHPWFKKEVTSPTPPTWPYRVLSEKDGVVLVEITPPGTGVSVEKPAPEKQSESSSDTDWPFTVSTGELGCKRLGNLRLVTLTVSGETYALNGAARSRIKEYGWRDGDEIWKRDPQHPDMRVGSRIIDKGISLCGPQLPVSPQLASKHPSTPEQQPTTAIAVDANIIVNLMNTMYGNVCHAEINGFFSKTLKLDWTANTRKIHAIIVKPLNFRSAI